MTQRLCNGNNTGFLDVQNIANLMGKNNIDAQNALPVLQPNVI